MKIYDYKGLYSLIQDYVGLHIKTSSARSATLGDASWDRLISQRRSSVSGGREGGHRTYFVDGGNN